MIELPEPLYESHLEEKKMCLVCAKNYASTALRTTDRIVVPICGDCSTDWNFYGYHILKRIKPARLIRRLIVFKLLRLFRKPSLRTIIRDIKGLQTWAKKMKRWM
jgi:hypothetical protein